MEVQVGAYAFGSEIDSSFEAAVAVQEGRIWCVHIALTASFLIVKPNAS